MKRDPGFTLVEIMIVVGIIGLLTLIAVPGYLHVMERTREKVCAENRRMIDDAKGGYEMEKARKMDVACTWSDILPYLKHQPECPAGGEYRLESIGKPCYCSYHDFRAGAAR